MDNKNRIQIIELYKRYGFEFVSSGYDTSSILVFTIRNGYYRNADIVPLVDTADTKSVFDQFSQMGFACQTKQVRDAEYAEDSLFRGFFSLDSVLNRLSNDYTKFTKSIVEIYSKEARYKYINAPYHVNGVGGEKSPADEVLSRLSSPKPILFLIEAAAGFGKTCTAYEIVNLLIREKSYLPLFSELSRNRQAVIFRHILLDEIDRTFPVLSSKLVQSEMKNGRVITILDGFDELLRKTDDGDDFEHSEPMLETIGEFLTGCAKVVLTTRRTILFEGDAFHAWVEKHADDFDLIKIRISEPNVEHWLPPERLKSLIEKNVDVENIANPVLLSYLRCIPDKDFEQVTAKPNQLIEKYFDFMLEREKTRQDLRMDVENQHEVLVTIARDMADFKYTSESRDYFVEHILKSCSKQLDDALRHYSSGERPTKEALANKLASHALLDRSGESNKIGFINEFVFGNYISKIIISTNWLDDDLRFIEPAVVSYKSRSFDEKLVLWRKLESSIEFLGITDQVDISVRLRNEIAMNLSNDEVQGLEFSKIEVGKYQIENFQFNECIFKKCIFSLANTSNITFLNCKYFDCVLSGKGPKGEVYVLGAEGDTDFINSLTNSVIVPVVVPEDRALLAQRFILEKFWPVGRDMATYKHRPIKGICVNSGEFDLHELYQAINTLKKERVLLEPMQTAFLEINMEEVLKIRQILGRDSQYGN